MADPSTSLEELSDRPSSSLRRGGAPQPTTSFYENTLRGFPRKILVQGWDLTYAELDAMERRCDQLLAVAPTGELPYYQTLGSWVLRKTKVEADSIIKALFHEFGLFDKSAPLAWSESAVVALISREQKELQTNPGYADDSTARSRAYHKTVDKAIKEPKGRPARRARMKDSIIHIRGLGDGLREENLHIPVHLVCEQERGWIDEKGQLDTDYVSFQKLEGKIRETGFRDLENSS
ncbi:MAG: hypothetical protein Q9227_009542, partial [Pyrenula ochraceoflavens]